SARLHQLRTYEIESRRAALLQQAIGYFLILTFDFDIKVPFRLAEKRRISWGFGVCLFEHRREPGGQACGCP
ncbi:MAG: hypothetical protein ACN4GR_17365, partial [Arenicellales bacterium]